MTAGPRLRLSCDREGAVVDRPGKRLLRRAALARVGGLFGFGLGLGAPMFAQCQMCKTAASLLQEKAAGALNTGIVVLGLPPIVILLGIGRLAYRYRNRSGLE